ncbi:Gibberellin-regulated protein 10 [Hibiscus syriacus]|uniref:Gibberellin-regulated protein 10 n=1 Tax=Hibiscus syriacus TaxID=106335 RepID=A0A6A3D2X5_HIBSY|nr:peamaclein-like [Hibiscus syriacus]KAE8733722.1 Gibberellin-regulated protein 10 [Hibiscus syriacus]
MKLVLVTFLFVSLVLSSFFFEESMAGYCAYKCKARCSKAEFKERCMKSCTICCQKCSCVPSAVTENKHECYCYRDMKNYKGLSKCP